MMFLFQALLVVTAAFWASAIVAEAAFVSDEERTLHPFIRATLGYFLMLVWFGVAWKYMTIGWAWVLGIALLALYGYKGVMASGGIGPWGAALFKKHSKPFVWILAGANFFVLPLHISGNYGPFTEMGGDVVAYSEMPKYLVDHNLPCYGVSDIVYDFKWYVKNKGAGFSDNRESLATFDEVAGNPPSAEYNGYRLSKIQTYSSFQSSPFGQWFFLSGATNYHVFYGVMAFQYACILGVVWGFFSRFGKRPALMAVFVAASSHGLTSIGYNAYYLQFTSLLISSALISALPSVRVFSWAGVRAYSPMLAFVSISYVHFMSVMAPLALIAAFGGKRQENVSPVLADERANRGKSSASRGYQAISSVIFLLLAIPVLIQDSLGELSRAWARVMSVLHMAKLSANEFMGDPIPFLSPQWLSQFFGSLSQQHFPPFVTPRKIVESLTGLSVGAGGLFMFCGAVAFIAFLRYGPKVLGGMSKRWVCALYVGGLFTVAAQSYVTQDSSYTQAKGAQNVLLALYFASLLPFAAIYNMRRQSKAMLFVAAFLGATALLFGVSMMVLKSVHSVKLAFSLGRCAIMEPSYYREASRIMAKSKNPFVIFEPRKSSDLYLSSEPFAGGRIVPTRHMMLSLFAVKGKIDVKTKPVFSEEFNTWLERDKDVLPCDLISEKDAPDTWIVRAVSNEKTMFGVTYPAHEWVSERLADIKAPRLIYSGWDYDIHSGQRLISAARGDKGMFSNMRNGCVQAYLPEGRDYEIIARLEPRAKSTAAEISSEMDKRIEAGEFGKDVSASRDGGILTLVIKISSKEGPRLVNIARFSREFWFNATINGVEM